MLYSIYRILLVELSCVQNHLASDVRFLNGAIKFVP